MNKIAAIVGLTWKAAFRYRLFWVLCALLAAAVVGLPLMIKDDGTAQGMVQILLTYTLSTTAALLGFATLWLSCGTLARDVEECQMQMVAVKPIARWQIWLGKWLGLLSLNAVLLALAGASIFVLLHWRAGRLPPDQQRILRDDIFVSRASASEKIPDFSADVEKTLRRMVKDPSKMSGFDLAELRKQINAALISQFTDLAPGRGHIFGIDLHTLQDRLRNKPLQLRIKFQTASANTETLYDTVWRVGPTNSTRQVEMAESFPADSFQDFTLPPNLLDDQGRLWIEVGNPNERQSDFPARRRHRAALSREHLRHQFHARPADHLLLAGLAVLHWTGRSQFLFVSCRGLRLAGRSLHRLIQRHGRHRGRARYHHRLRRRQGRIWPHGGRFCGGAHFHRRAQNHQSGARLFAD